MHYRQLGRSGMMVSPLILGGFNFGGPTPEKEAAAIINAALEAGINMIDTADMYYGGESERIIGKALKDNGKRHEIILASKVGWRTGDGPNDGGVSRYHILRSVEASLRRLQCETIDLYQLHRPFFNIPQEESLRALDDLIHSGKVHSIGSSTFPAWAVMESLAISEKLGLNRFISEQPPFNLLDRRIENELIPLCQRYEVAVIPWAPLASGILAGRYQSAEGMPPDTRGGRLGGAYAERVNPAGIEIGLAVARMAQERGMSAAQLALLWVKDHPGITAPIIGPRTLAHLEEALAVMEMHLKEEDRPLFDELVHPGNFAADFHNTSGWTKASM